MKEFNFNIFNYIDKNDPNLDVIERLIILQEECAEVSFAISKIMRFGMTDEKRDALVQEIGDLQEMIRQLVNAGFVTDEEVETARQAKQEKLKKWMYTP